MRFIHAADIHLDSPLRGLASYDGAPADEIRGATRRALANLVSLAVDTKEDIDFILISGDLYDGDWRDYNTGLFFSKQMSILADANVSVFIVKGNHDAESQITKYLDLPSNVKVFSTSHPETILLDDLGVAIHGQSFASRGVADHLAEGYTNAVSGLFNIGLLHTSATGYSGHDECAPCSVASLSAKGYDYWALGHIHKRQEVCHPKSGESPWIIFPGNIQGRHARETGPKGCAIVTVSDGEISAVEHRDLDVVRWYLCDVDAAKTVFPDDVMQRVQMAVEEKTVEAPEHLLAIRIEIRGTCSANSALRTYTDRWINQIRANAVSDQVWIEKVKILTENENDDNGADDWNDLLSSISQIASSQEDQQKLLRGLAELRLPNEFITGDETINLSDPNVIVQALPDVQQILVSRLLGKEE